jgi:predicted component of type VI protein secretion system
MSGFDLRQAQLALFGPDAPLPMSVRRDIAQERAKDSF